MIVLFNDTDDNHTIVPGMKILDVNGHKPAEILARFLPKLSADGDIETGQKNDVGNFFAQYYWSLFEQTDSFTITASSAGDKPIVARLTGVTDVKRKQHHN